jgi:type I secretion target repeat protein|nr:MAG TPA: hypothetical protein [Caudoviricetes sp.]
MANVTSKDIGLAFVKIQPSMEGFAPALKRGVGEALGEVNASAGEHGEGLAKEYGDGAEKAMPGALAAVGGRMKSSLGETLKDVAHSAGILGAGAMIAETVGEALKGAVERYKARNLFELQLKGMGYSKATAQRVANIVVNSVLDTQFKIQDAVKVSNQYLMSGGAVSGLERYMSVVKNMAAVAHRSIEDIGDVLVSANASGKLTGETMERLTERGISARQAIAQHFNMSLDEVDKAVRDRAISFDQFLEAMASDPKYANMANTVGGSFEANIGNIKSRLAALLENVISPMLDWVSAKMPVILDQLSRVNTYFGSHREKLQVIMRLLAFMAAMKPFNKLMGQAWAFIKSLNEVRKSTLKQIEASSILRYRNGVLAKSFQVVAFTANTVGKAMWGVVKSVGPLLIFDVLTRLVMELDKRFHFLGKVSKWVADRISDVVNVVVELVEWLQKLIDKFNNWLYVKSHGKHGYKGSKLYKPKRSSSRKASTAEPTSQDYQPESYTPASMPVSGVEEKAASASKAATKSAKKSQKDAEKAAKKQQKEAGKANREAEKERERAEKTEQEAEEEQKKREKEQYEQVDKYANKSLDAVQFASQQASTLAQPFITSKGGKALAQSLSTQVSGMFGMAHSAMNLAKLYEDPAGYIMDLANAGWQMVTQRANAAVQAFGGGVSEVNKAGYNLAKDALHVDELETLGLADKVVSSLPDAGQIVTAVGNVGSAYSDRFTSSDMFQKSAKAMLRPIVVNGYSSNDVADKIDQQQRRMNAQYAGVMA